jgi:hypothetical protein
MDLPEVLPLLNGHPTAAGRIRWGSVILANRADSRRSALCIAHIVVRSSRQLTLSSATRRAAPVRSSSRRRVP